VGRAGAFALLALANLMWSGNWILGRALRESFDPIALNFWRWLVALLILAPFAAGAAWEGRAVIRRHAALLAFLALWPVV
jgi:drug/metabolite transporter (DMT)-like permease